MNRKTIHIIVEFFAPPLAPSPSLYPWATHSETGEWTVTCFEGSFGLGTLQIPPLYQVPSLPVVRYPLKCPYWKLGLKYCYPREPRLKFGCCLLSGNSRLHPVLLWNPPMNFVVGLILHLTIQDIVNPQSRYPTFLYYNNYYYILFLN